jgi:outer membrane immunogenic protein
MTGNGLHSGEFHMKTNFGFAVAAISFFGAGSVALAADLPARTYTKAPVVVAAPVYNWTGCYIGAEGGGNWGRANTTNLTGAATGLPLTAGYNLSGGLAGGTIGCNYQTGHLVIGIEGDASWTNKSGSANDIAPFNLTTVNTLKERWFDTVRGRIGYAWDRVLVYATAGGAFAGTNLRVTDILGNSAFDSQTRSGWTAGVGIEYAFLDNWSVKLEYLHADFGSKTYINPAQVINGATFNTRSISLTDDLVRVGINYRFGWGGPVVAKY